MRVAVLKCRLLSPGGVYTRLHRGRNDYKKREPGLPFFMAVSKLSAQIRKLVPFCLEIGADSLLVDLAGRAQWQGFLGDDFVR